MPTRFEDFGERPAAAGADTGVVVVFRRGVSRRLEGNGEIDKRGFVVREIVGVLVGLKTSSDSSTNLLRFAEVFLRADGSTFSESERSDVT